MGENENHVKIQIGQTKWGSMAYVANDEVGLSLFQGKLHDEDVIFTLLYNIVSRSKLILDIGAHAGSHSVLYSKINPSARIYAFEPQFNQFHVLQYNIKTLEASNVTPIKFALGNKECGATMCKYIRDGPNAGVSICENLAFNLGGCQLGEGGETVNIRRLDNFASELGLETISYIKLDVEGFENIVVDGGYEIIKKYKPILFFESNHKKIEADMAEFYITPRHPTIFDTLKSLDYNIFDVGGGNYLAI